jgi:hypothetical protein
MRMQEQEQAERELLDRSDREILDLDTRLEEHRQLGELYTAEGEVAEVHRVEGIALVAMHEVAILRRDMLAPLRLVHASVDAREDPELVGRVRMLEVLVAGLANLQGPLDAAIEAAATRSAGLLRRLEALERHVIPRR